jgi:pyruvyl transferase EpsO
MTNRSISRLAATYSELVSPAFEGVDRVVMLDYPNHGNVGDNAIWLGELAYLRNASIPIDHVADIPRYSPARVQRALGAQGAIVLHGGGNFGDVWPKHQVFRELVARNHPKIRIIQLPQSVHFDSASLSLGNAIREHPEFFMFARDAASRTAAEHLFGRAVHLAPDAAHLCRLPEVSIDRPSVVLGRRDNEAFQVAEATGIDWVTNAVGLAARWNRTHRSLCRRFPSVGRFGGLQAFTWERLALQHLERGCRLLGSGAIVITDRLHAMLLGLQMGRPVVAIENRLGKLGNYCRTWGITEGDGLRFAQTFRDAASYVESPVANAATNATD